MICKICKRDLTDDEFYFQNNGKRSSDCQDCRRQAGREKNQTSRKHQDYTKLKYRDAVITHDGVRYILKKLTEQEIRLLIKEGYGFVFTQKTNELYGDIL
jgi:hypothetical protein